MKTNKKPLASQDMMNHIMRSNADQQLHVVIHFNCQLDAARLEKAMHLAVVREPVLGCRFVEDIQRPYWEEREDLTELVLSRTIVTHAVDADLMSFVITPSDPALDPLFQARIFRCPDEDVLCIKVNHVVADGAGTKEVAYLVADTYSRLEKDPFYNPVKSPFSPRSQMGFFKQAGIFQMLKYRPRKLGMPKPQLTLPFSDQGASGRQFVLRRINPHSFKELKAYGKIHQATINDLILTAYYRALFQAGSIAEDSFLPIQVSIDLRPFLPSGKEQRICNLSSALFPMINNQPGESFTATLERVIEKMTRWKSHRPGLTGAMLIELALIRGYGKAKAFFEKITSVRNIKANPLLLSNFGILDPKCLVFGGHNIIDAFELGPVMYGHGLMLTISTYAGRMTLAMGFCQGMISSKIVENLLQNITDELLFLVTLLPTQISAPMMALAD